jgi:hypothetical protein
VSHFWNMVGWSVKEGLIDVDFVRSGFGDAIDIYHKLRDVEILIRKEIETRDRPDLTGEEIEQLAKDRIENEWLVSWLYQEWKKPTE